VEQNTFGFVDLRSQIVAATTIRVQLLDKAAVRQNNVFF
jgi:hypothetical protein